MLFNSAIFLLLFLAFYLLYWPLPLRGKHILIILASVLFYAWYSLPFLLLFLFILFFSYIISIPIVEKKSRTALWLGLVVVLSNLFFFKYFYLLASGLGHIIGSDYLIHIKTNWQERYKVTIVLPIAISFYTFQIVAYLVDCYRGTIPRRIPLRKYIVFILYFPQFIAGPIMRSEDFMDQIDRPRPSVDRMLNGSLLILQGVVKKVLIADQIGAAIGPVFAQPEKYHASMLLLLVPGFISQIYADFSGYTDMARGMSKLLGYEIPENFRGPFLSESLSELWNRWHITLSTWLRDYIYFPLGGSRQGEARTYTNLLVTMGLGGLWHGANWTMLVWGLYMGGFLCLERWLGRTGFLRLPDTKWMHKIRVLRTYLLFGLSGIFFAASDINHSLQIIRGLLSWQNGVLVAKAGLVAFLCIVVYLFNAVQYDSRLANWLTARTRLRYGLVASGTFVVGLLVSMYGDTSGSFIYFAF